MERSTWKGSISFGLVNIPVILYNSEDASERVSFHQIDKRDNARIKYQRVNATTGALVPWENIGRAYEYDKETILPVEEGELERVAGENGRTIAIETFVNKNDLNFIDIDKTYYLLPDKKADKGYVILRESLKKSAKIAIGKVIITTKEYIAAVACFENALVLYLLRYHHQIKPLSDFKLPSENLKEYKVSAKEIDIAMQLIKSMSSKWDPQQYQDEYQEAVHQWAENKVKNKSAYKMPARGRGGKNGEKLVDFIDLLKKSLGATKKSNARPKKTNLAALKRQHTLKKSTAKSRVKR